MAGVGGKEVEFLLNIQKLLSEGQFTATYKFALLTALADICVERGHDSDDPFEIGVAEIAAKFVEYYWGHTVPFSESVLVQTHGRPAAVLTRLEETRRVYPTLALLGRSREYRRVLSDVGRIVKDQPLWKLQTVRSGQFEFLYRNDFGANKITLQPGVCRYFRLFHGLVTDIVRGAWIDFIRRLRANQEAIGKCGDLEQFLFGESRGSLLALRGPLREIQEGRCFYCESRLGDQPHVDHFIPWSVYRRDLGHNFVLADGKCNRAKSAMLAGLPHLDAWVRRNRDLGGMLAERFDSAGIVHDLGATVSVARHAYHHAGLTGASLWTAPNETSAADDRWRSVIRA